MLELREVTVACNIEGTIDSWMLFLPFPHAQRTSGFLLGFLAFGMFC